MKSSWLEFRKQHWDARSAQERMVMRYTGWALLPLLIYLILWQPAHDAVKKLQLAVPAMTRQAEKLRVQADEVEMLRHRAKPALLGAVALKTSVEESAQRHGLSVGISGLDLQEPNAVRISFASVPFEQWLLWLRALQQEQHIRADSVSVAMLPQAGMVKINATLINGGTQ